MDERTLEALKASIEKWDVNANATDFSQIAIGNHNYPLCKIYRPYYTGSISCGECPVRMKSLESFCVGTPYDNVIIIYSTAKEEGYITDEFRTAARAEADFLRSLLPEGEKI